MHASGLIVMMLFLAFSSSVFSQEQSSPEYRMCWILTLENPETLSPEGIQKTIDACRDANINAIVPVVRRRGRSYYESKIEPFYNPDPEKPLGFDPLAEFIKYAHDTSNGKQRI